MKKLFLFLVVSLLVSNVFAQTADPAQLRKDGDEALKAKNYAVAYEKYNAYISAGNQDTIVIYNCAVCADNTNKYAEAAKYFDQSVKLGYNPESSYVGLAKAYMNLKKEPELAATVKAGLEKFPANKNLEKIIYVFSMKEGQAQQKAGEVKKAAESFTDALIVTDKTMKTNVLLSLGILYYNKGAGVLTKATPLATSDPDKYKAEKEAANGDFKKASDYLKEALELSPDNANAKKTLDAVTAAMK